MEVEGRAALRPVGMRYAHGFVEPARAAAPTSSTVHSCMSSASTTRPVPHTTPSMIFFPPPPPADGSSVSRASSAPRTLYTHALPSALTSTSCSSSVHPDTAGSAGATSALPMSAPALVKMWHSVRAPPALADSTAKGPPNGAPTSVHEDGSTAQSRS